MFNWNISIDWESLKNGYCDMSDDEFFLIYSVGGQVPSVASPVTGNILMTDPGGTILMTDPTGTIVMTD